MHGRFTLPPEHAPALAEENGPFFFGGVLQMIPATIGVLGQVTEAFRKGGGVPYEAYNADWWDGMERFSNIWFENLLTQQWIPAMPGVQKKLEDGARVADVGCGRGRALIKLAQAFPNSRYVGYDVFGPSIERASANARQRGSRVRSASDSLTCRKAYRSNTTSSRRLMSSTTRPIPSDYCAPFAKRCRPAEFTLFGHQLLAQARGELWAPWCSVPRLQRALLHDHIPRCGRGRTRHVGVP